MLYAYLTSLFWGISSVLYVELLKVFSPILLFLLHGILFSWITVYVYIKERKNILDVFAHKTYLIYAVITLIMVIITQYLFYKSLESKNNNTHKSITIAYTAPVVSLAILWILQKEKITIYSFIGVLLIVSGIVFLTVYG